MLRYLNLRGLGLLTDASIEWFIKVYLYMLRYLNLRGLGLLTDASIEWIARSCTRLRSLDLGKGEL